MSADNSTIQISQDEYSNLLRLKFFLTKYLSIASADGPDNRRILRQEMAELIGLKNHNGIEVIKSHNK